MCQIRSFPLEEGESEIKIPDVFEFIGLEIDEPVGGFGHLSKTIHLFVKASSDGWEDKDFLCTRKIVIKMGKKLEIGESDNDKIDLKESDILLGIRRMGSENYYVIDKGWVNDYD